MSQRYANWGFATLAAGVVAAMVGLVVWPVLPAIFGWFIVFDWWR